LEHTFLHDKNKSKRPTFLLTTEFNPRSPWSGTAISTWNSVQLMWRLFSKTNSSEDRQLLFDIERIAANETAIVENPWHDASLPWPRWPEIDPYPKARLRWGNRGGGRHGPLKALWRSMASWRGLGGAGGKVRLAITGGVRCALPLPAIRFDLLGQGSWGMVTRFRLPSSSF
jgi:hypothetical protein